MKPIQKQAIKNTIKLLGGVTLLSVLFNLAFTFIPLAILGYISAAVILGWFVWMFYSIELSKLESREKLREMTKNNPTLN